MPAIVSIGPLQGSPQNVGMLTAPAQVGASGSLGCISVPVSMFNVRKRTPIKYTISGLTRDSTQAVLGNCTLKVFEVVNGAATNEEPKGRLVNMGTSDANGNYSIEVYSSPGVTFNVDAYKAGSPDLAGTTVNTLVGAQVG